MMTENSPDTPNADDADPKLCAQAALENIQRVYGLSADDLTIPAKTLDALRTAMSSTADDTTKRIEKAVTASGLSADEKTYRAIYKTCMGNIMSYWPVFHTRRKVYDASASSIDTEKYTPAYTQTQAREYITAIYGNHVTRLGEENLRALGLTDAEAHLLNGHCIRRSVEIYDTVTKDLSVSRISPPRNPSLPVSDAVAEVDTFWRDQANKLDELVKPRRR